MQSLQELDLDDTEFVSRLCAAFGLEEIELASSRLSHFDDTAKGIFVLACPFQADGDLIGLHSFLRLEMHIAKATGRLATPDELSAGIDFQRIATKAPACQFQTDIIDGGLLGKLIRDPGRRESAVVLPLRQFVVVKALGSMFRIVASLSRNNRDATSLFGIGRC